MKLKKFCQNIGKIHYFSLYLESEKVQPGPENEKVQRAFLYYSLPTQNGKVQPSQEGGARY